MRDAVTARFVRTKSVHIQLWHDVWTLEDSYVAISQQQRAVPIVTNAQLHTRRH